MNTPTGQRRGGRPMLAGGRAMRTGTGIFLIAAGAILRFAVPAGSPHGLNVHVVGVVLILAGILGLLLSLLVRGGPLNQRRQTRQTRPNGPDGSYDSRAEEPGRAAAVNVAAVQEDDRFVSPDTPGRQESDH